MWSFADFSAWRQPMENIMKGETPSKKESLGVIGLMTNVRSVRCKMGIW